MTNDCPVCGAEMVEDTAIGPYCAKETCPVSDDALLWYKNSKGEWRSQHWIVGPPTEFPGGGFRRSMELSEKEE